MPSMEEKRGVKRWRGHVMVKGLKSRKWFPDASKASERAAHAWEEQERGRLEKLVAEAEKIATASMVLDLGRWLDEYLDHVELKNKPKVYRRKKAEIRRFLQHFRVNKDRLADDPLYPALADFGLDDAEEYLSLVYRERSGHCANNIVRSMLAVAWDWGRKRLRRDGFPVDKINPFREAERFPEQRTPRYVPPKTDFEKVMAVATGQDRVMLRLFYQTGARKGEVFERLTIDDLDFHGNRIRLWSQKGRGGNMKGEWVPMHSDLREDLLWWLSVRPLKDVPHVFYNVAKGNVVKRFIGQPFATRGQWMKTLCELAEVKRFGCHGIRHRAAVDLYEGGASLSQVQKLLRHDNAKTTENYLKSLGIDLSFTREVMESALCSTVIPARDMPESGLPYQ